jgi:deoxyxylulose-5-phosphate synthase
MPTDFPALLPGIQSPADLRGLTLDELQRLADELRQFLVRTVATRGGHFAAGLGTVELDDRAALRLQHAATASSGTSATRAYPHKILTGRRDQMHTHRQRGGISALSAPQRIRIRHLRHRALVSTSISRRAGHGRRLAPPGRQPGPGRRATSP